MQEIDSWLAGDSKRAQLKQMVGGLSQSFTALGYPLQNEVGSYYCKLLCGEINACTALATNAPKLSGGAKLDPMQPAKCYLYSTCIDRVEYKPALPQTAAWQGYTLLTKRACKDIKPELCGVVRGVDFATRKSLCDENAGAVALRENCPKSCGLCGAAKWVRTDDWSYEPNHYCYPKVWDQRSSSSDTPDLYDCQLECAEDLKCKAISWNQKSKACYKAQYCSSSPDKDRDFSIYYKPHDTSTPSPTYDKRSLMAQVRLVANRTYSETKFHATGGRLEVNHNGEWGTVCSHKWRHSENGWANANVICKQLGYARTEGFSTNSEFMGDVDQSDPNYIPPVSFPILLDEVQCSGEEPAIEECFHKPWGEHMCPEDHSQDVGLWCSTQAEEVLYNKDPPKDQIRLYYPDAPGGTETAKRQGKQITTMTCHIENPVGSGLFTKTSGASCQLFGGYLEVHARNHWGAVCDDDFNMKSAHVACRQLGYDHATGIWDQNKEVGRNALFGAHETEDQWIILDDVECQGDESDVFDCYHRPLFTHNCSPTETVAILCTGIPFNNNLEGTYQLIKDDGTPQNPGFFGGRLEVYHDGLWGSVCDDGFKEHAGRLACKEVNKDQSGQPLTPHMESVYPSAHFGSSIGPIWLDDFECTEKDTKLSDCTHGDFGVTNCSHGEDVGVTCAANPARKGSEGELALKGGNARDKPRDYWEGRLEIFHNNEWGTVCAQNGWDMKATTVACKEMGFKYGVSYWSDAHFGPGWGKIWYEQVHCNGQEDTLQQCNVTPYQDKKDKDGGGRRLMGTDDLWDFDWGGFDWGGSSAWSSWGNCDHTDDVSIVCSNLDEHVAHTGSAIRLVGDPALGANSTYGRIEVRYNNEWGTVCDDGFGIAEATVACKQLGYVKAAEFFPKAEFGEGIGQIWMDDLSCKKDLNTGEYPDSLAMCEKSGHYGDTNCKHNEDVGVGCSDDESGKLRLCTQEQYAIDQCANDNNLNEGVLLVNVGGEWGTVCESNYDSWECKKDDGVSGLAKHVCEQLRLGAPERYWKNAAYDSPIAGINKFPVHWKDVNCRGDESSIYPFGDSACGGTECYPDGTSGEMDHACRTGCGDHGKDVHIRCGQVQEWQTYGPKQWQVLTQLTISKQGNPNYPKFKNEGLCEGETSDFAAYEIGGKLGLRGTTAMKRNYTASGLLVGWQQNWMSISQVACENMCHMAGDDCNYVAYNSATKQCFFYKSCNNDGADYPGFKVYNKLEFETPNRPVNFEHVRLRGGDVYEEGRLEVFHNHTWSTVCDTGLDRHADAGMWLAHVACRELGFAGAVAYYGASRFGCPLEDTVPVSLNKVVCDQNSVHIGDCDHEPWGNITSTNCQYHNNDVSIRCADQVSDDRVPDGQLRLMDGEETAYYKTGRLEVAFNGQWGTVCDDGFTIETSDVACRQMGFAYGAERFYPGNSVAFKHVKGSGHIWMDDVVCNKTHDFLIDCDYTKENNCKHSEDIGLKCTNQPPKTHAAYVDLVRLVDDTGHDVAAQSDKCNATACTGRVEVRESTQAEWGTVCNNGLWGDKKWNVANVLCKGDIRLASGDRFNYAVKAWADSDTRWTDGDKPQHQWASMPIGMDDVRCRGDEPSILACYALDPGVNNCDHSHDLQVTCSNRESIDACKTLKKKFCESTSTCVELCTDCNDLPILDHKTGACGRCQDTMGNSRDGRMCSNAATEGNCVGLSTYEKQKCPASCGLCSCPPGDDTGCKAPKVGTPTTAPTKAAPSTPGANADGTCNPGYGPDGDCTVKQACEGGTATGWKHDVGNVYDCSKHGNIRGNQVDGCRCVCNGGWKGSACNVAPETHDDCESKWCTGAENKVVEVSKQRCIDTCREDMTDNCNRLTWEGDAGKTKNEGSCKLWFDNNDAWSCTESTKVDNDKRNRFAQCLNRQPSLNNGVRGHIDLNCDSSTVETNKAEIQKAIADAFTYEIQDQVPVGNIEIMSHSASTANSGFQRVEYALTGLSENEAEYATKKASDSNQFPYDVQKRLGAGLNGVQVTCQGVCAQLVKNGADPKPTPVGPNGNPVDDNTGDVVEAAGDDTGLILGLILLFAVLIVGGYFGYKYWIGRRIEQYAKHDAILYSGGNAQELGQYEAPSGMPITNL